MNNQLEDSEEALKQGKNSRTVRFVWLTLIPIFAVIILLRLYAWHYGKENLTSILAPLGMISLGITQLVGTENKPLYYVFLIIALILVVAGLLTVFIR